MNNPVNLPRRAEPKLPPGSNLPPPNMRATTLHDDHADEAARAAQRYHQQVAEIEALKTDVEDWRRRAMVADEEVRRLEKREADLTAKLDRMTEEAADKLDNYKLTLSSLATHGHLAGKMIVEFLDIIETVSGRGKRQSQVDLEALAIELEKPADQKPEGGPPPLPSVVTAGPRNPEA